MDVKKHYEKQYVKKDDHQALSISKLSSWHKKIFLMFLESGADELNGKKVLDVGSWNGMLLRLLMQRGVIPFAVDISPSSVKYLHSQGITARQVDLSDGRIPFASRAFDAVIMSETIEHIFDGQHALDEVYRVLKKGGSLYITTHNTFNVFMRLKFLLGMVPTPSLDVSDKTTCGEHIRIFNEKTLKRLLYQAGFKCTKLKDRSFLAIKLAGSIRLVEPPFKSLFSNHIFFVVKK
ncbi:class I SAM-dependent methyltransferase [Candidatus Woesearchaeota archaeon]|nr:class I SAM-dependent methyltransferase [Candidatus Woesearchaeota archaeon]